MGKLIIASDTSIDLSKELIEKYNITTCPFSVILGEEQYKDGVDITPDDIYDYAAKTGTLGKTAAINVAEAEEFFRSLKENDDDEIIFFTISKTLSGTNQYACVAAAEVGGVYVIDTKNLSTGGGLSAIKACEMRDSGKTAEEIVDFINKFSCFFKNYSYGCSSMFIYWFIYAIWWTKILFDDC